MSMSFVVRRIAFVLAAWCIPTAASARCDLSVPGNKEIINPANCLVWAAERDGIVMGLKPDGKRQIDMAKVPRCTAIGAEIMKKTGAKQRDFIGTTSFGSTFTFEARCSSIVLECQVLVTGDHPVLNKAPWGAVSMRCDATPDRFTEALRITTPSVGAGAVRPFVSQCLAATKAGKQEGPQDREVGAYMLICDPQHPDGPTVRIEPVQ
jgi:hypothetical protein